MRRTLKCIKCETENIRAASFCKNCGYEFTDKEKEVVKKWGIVWFLEKFDKAKSVWNLGFITDHILFKIGSIVLVLAIGIYFWITNGINIKLKESSEYNIQYNEKNKEYYLLTEKEQTELNLYIPNRAKEISIKHMDQNGKELDKKDYKQSDKIILNNNGEEDYYLIEAMYDKNNLDQIKLYVFRKMTE